MFDGKAKKRAAISLRGKSKKEEKKEFLQKAAADRERRAEERRRALAALQIQRYWRGRSETWHYREALRADLQKKAADMGKVRTLLSLQGVNFQPPAPVLMQLVTQIVAFLDPVLPGDCALLLELCPSILAGLRPNAEGQVTDSADPNSLLVLAASMGAVWWHSMRKLLRLATTALYCQKKSKTSTENSEALLLQLLDSSVFEKLENISMERTLHLRLSLLCPSQWILKDRKTLRETPKAKYQQTVASLLALHWGLPGTSTSGAVSQLWSFCLDSLGVEMSTEYQNLVSPGTVLGEMRSAALGHFAAAMLSLPNLQVHPQKKSLVKGIGGSGWAKIVSALGTSHTGAWIEKAPVRAVAITLKNVLDLLSQHSGVCLPDVVKALHHLVSRLPLQAVEDSNDPQLRQEMEIAIDSEEEDMDEDAEKSGKNLDWLVRIELRKQLQQQAGAKGVEATLGPEDLQAVRTSFSALMDSHMIAAFFNSVLSPVSRQTESEKSDDPNEEVDPVLALSGLYANLIMYDTENLKEGSLTKRIAGVGIRAKALNTLALAWPNDPIVLRLWLHLSSHYDIQEFASTGTAVPNSNQGSQKLEDSGGAPLNRQLARAFYLLCAVYNHQLLALSDEDFFERQHPLPVQSVQELVRCLGSLLSRTFWTRSLVFGPTLYEESKGLSGPVDLTGQDRLEEVYLMHAATRVFNQLYERSLRRRFCDPQEWYWHHLSDKDLLPPPAEGNPAMEDPQQWQHVYATGKIAFLLNNIPQVIPFSKRVQIFRRLLAGEKARARQLEQQQQPPQGNLFENFLNAGSTRVKVRRPFLYEDSYEALNGLGNKLKGRVQVTFENEHGMEEAGIDGGGVFKEFMDAITKRTFDPRYGLFWVTSEQLLFPNPSSGLSVDNHLSHFEFAGRILGKALFEDILVEPQFANFFLNMLLGKHNQFDDLFSLDPELYRNLSSLKDMASKGQDVSDLCLSFSVTATHYGQHRTVNLCPDGENVAVTNDNAIRYIHLMANYKLNVETAVQSRSFLKGFRDIIPVEWIRLFSPQELQLLIGGDVRRIDIQNLQQNVHYASGYHGSQPYIQTFWQILESFTAQEQAAFLKFVTSCSRQPLLGFQHLHPTFSIQKVPAGEDDSRLPSSGTCMNLLKLPQYSNTETLRRKLLYAINSNAGFELS